MNENGNVNMMETEERLQQRLEQLAAGQPLEDCVQDLPENEARLVRLAVSLQRTAIPAAEETAAADQRDRVLRAAAKTLAPATAAPSAVPWLDRLRAGVDQLLSRRELAVGLGAALVVVLLLAAGVGLSRWQQNRQAPALVQEEDGGAAETTAVPAETAVPPTSAEVAVAPTEAGAPAAAETRGHQLFLPLTTNPLQVDAQTAAVHVDHGLVEIQTDADGWTAVPRAATLAAGQRVRTGPLSSATLTFFDGSQAFLGPDTELSIDELNAQRPENGFRTVVLTQWLGESEHSVDFRNDRGSRYEVNTPGGSGIARGTRFRVAVADDLQARFSVSEGRVDVTNAGGAVSIIAGQMTTSRAGRLPDEPAFTISGEGEVTAAGAEWVIAGQTFQTNDDTIIVGNPQVGDLVRVEGHLQPDGARMADVIVLLRRAVSNRFQLSGTVEMIGVDAWTVAGQTIAIDAETEIDDAAAVGDGVWVAGVLQSDGTLLARRIRLAAAARPFAFTGVVQAMGSDGWRISGREVVVDAETAVDDNLTVGEVVAVRGRIVADVWRAEQIERVTEPERRFSFTGVVQSISPWQVAGIALETRAWTVIAPGAAVGDRVRVQGIVAADGTWVAERIDLLPDDDDDDDGPVLIIIGVIGSIDPLIVNGIPLDFDDDSNGNGTAIVDGIHVNSLVQVIVRIGTDGRWIVTDVRVIRSGFGLGCLTISSVVVGIDVDELVLRHWPAISLANVSVSGNVSVNSVVTLPICTGFDGVVIITNIIVIYESIIIVAPPASGGGNGHGGPPPPSGNGNSNGNFNGNSNG